MNLLSSDPNHGFSLAQIARHLGVSKATCLPMVSELTVGGWLVRHPVHKTYRLGPALVPLGRSAQRSAGLSELLLLRMIDLANATGHTCLVWVPSADCLVLAEIVNARGSLTSWAGLKRGHRLKPVPPLGSSLVAWSGDAAVARWLQEIGSDKMDSERVRYEGALRASRSRGYVVELGHTFENQLLLFMEQLAAEHPEILDDLAHVVRSSVSRKLGELDVLVGPIDEASSYSPVSINAPVCGSGRDVEAVVCLVDAPGPMSGSELDRIGCLVRDTCVEISRAIGGSPHWILTPDTPGS